MFVHAGTAAVVSSTKYSVITMHAREVAKQGIVFSQVCLCVCLAITEPASHGLWGSAGSKTLIYADFFQRQVLFDMQ